MDISVFLARFWGSLFVILGLATMGAGFLGRVIGYTEEKTITIATGYITLLLGLATVSAHNLWVGDWRAAITILGWVTLLKGGEKTMFPERVNKIAQKFKAGQIMWGAIILAMGGWLLLMGLRHG